MPECKGRTENNHLLSNEEKTVKEKKERGKRLRSEIALLTCV
jgi:hypothetical protein